MTETKRERMKQPLDPELMKRIEELHKMGYGTRRIAPRVDLSRKRVREALVTLGRLEPRTRKRDKASKLDAFRNEIREKVDKNLTASRILREITEKGYRGGSTILTDYIRTLRATPTPKKKVWRRFETPPADEIQIDWSPYRVPIGGRQRVVHAFAATLCFSRKIHVHFYPDERQSTLLEAHVRAFNDFGGVTRRCVYDRMSTVVLGTIGKDRKPLWHPRFTDFCRYYGYEPFLCQVADPDRKGKDEKVFAYLEPDFIRGSEFDSLDDLNTKVRIWLDEVANRRVHGTTRRIPDEAWEQEKPLLTALPDSPFAAFDEEVRLIGPDSVVSVRGTPYTVPATLAHQTLAVRLYSDHFELCDRNGHVAFSRRYVPDSEHGRLALEPMHYESIRRRSSLPGGSTAKLEDALLTRFPDLAELCAGIRTRMKSLAHVHLRALWRLADRYGDEAFHAAASRAQHFHRHDANAIKRILETDHPLPDEEPEAPLTAAARVLVELGDVDGGSIDDYAHFDDDEDEE
jgi:transposase